jgi:hypothetical protein
MLYYRCICKSVGDLTRRNISVKPKHTCHHVIIGRLDRQLQIVGISWLSVNFRKRKKKKKPKMFKCDLCNKMFHLKLRLTKHISGLKTQIKFFTTSTTKLNTHLKKTDVCLLILCLHNVNSKGEVPEFVGD